jgi:hypothetical protein
MQAALDALAPSCAGDSAPTRICACPTALRAEYPDDADFIIAFAGAAVVIADSAGPDDCELVHARISAALERCGLWSGAD